MDLAVIIIARGVSVNAVEVEWVIIIKEARKYLHQLIMIALTLIINKMSLKLTLYFSLSINTAFLALKRTKIALLTLIAIIYT
jgi:hypothetical protein